MTLTNQSPTTNLAPVRTTGLRRRMFAGMWKSMDAAVDIQIAPAKDLVLSEARGPIVEIGAGHGSSFSRYPTGTRVTAFEPNTYMSERLANAAQEAGIELTHRTEDLREAQLPTGSVSTVVSVLTLCSVADRAGLVAEIHRVLRPSGRFIFVEHIAESADKRRRRFQRIIRPTWKALADGCDPCSPTDELIAKAGFSTLEATSENLGPAFDPTNLTHWGVATK
jgi:SAM-dependent methyltransferase